MFHICGRIFFLCASILALIALKLLVEKKKILVLLPKENEIWVNRYEDYLIFRDIWTCFLTVCHGSFPSWILSYFPRVVEQVTIGGSIHF